MNAEAPQQPIKITQENFEVLQALAGDAYETAIPHILRALAAEVGISTDGADDHTLRAVIRKNAQNMLPLVEVVDTEKAA